MNLETSVKRLTKSGLRCVRPVADDPTQSKRASHPSQRSMSSAPAGCVPNLARQPSGAESLEPNRRSSQLERAVARSRPHRRVLFWRASGGESPTNSDHARGESPRRHARVAAAIGNSSA